eukprot:CAMPEP_0177782194 /NCGR_PEP_ID=MMETSP0491_2-20121128/18309_1 /TAXON_ID=63592 /ORGANISM="Tetraselmis chuii, Strain PLY429" /LENGTH=535 /DNA_ID=CAMNT_0019302421 /DNA_START=473 /DNA_END=2080 /DNA_ORIENTATION=-
MGCGASKSEPGVSSPAAVQQHIVPEQNGASDPPRKEIAPTTDQSYPQQRIPEAVNPNSAGSPVPGATGTTETEHTALLDIESDSGRGSGGKENGKERQADAWQAGADSSKTVPVVAINAGKVSAKVKTILDHEDEDEFASSDTAVEEIPSSVSGKQSNHASQGGTFLMQGAAKIDNSGTSNPISDSFADGDGSIQSQMKPVKAAAPRKVEDHAFASIAPGGNLPSLTSFQRRADPNWLGASALDHLGEESPNDNSRARADDVHDINGVDDVLVLKGGFSEEEEEDDVFDMNGMSAPAFQYEGRNRAQPASVVAAVAEEELDPDDPWASLQNQYRIREDMGSPTVSGRKEHRKANSTGVRAGHTEWSSSLRPDEELVLDIDAESGTTAVVKYSAVSSKPGRKAREGGSFRTSAGPKEASWGQGEMARAGDIMLGRGALDIGDDDLNGQLDALYAEDNNLSEQSFDVSAPEMPLGHPKGADIAMEDFIEEIETYGGKADGVHSASLADKLAQFEAGFDEDEDLMIQEELRIMSQNNS